MSHGVRANWHVDVPDAAAEGDPFGQAIEDVGVPVDLDAGPGLVERLAELVAMESTLFNLGVRCPIKDRPDTACSACPFRARNGGTQLGQLCEVGVAQEQTCTEIAVIRHVADGG